MNNFDPILLDFLRTHEIAYSYHEHIPIFTVEESLAIEPSIPGRHTKNLFLTDKAGGFFLVTICAEKRFPLKIFRKFLGTKELSFASAEQLSAQLHLTPGSVSVCGLIYAPPTLQVYIDHDLWTAPEVGRHPNRNDATIVFDHTNLEKFLTHTGHHPHIIEFDDERIKKRE